MITACSLTDKNCVPCQGGVPALDQHEADTFLNELQNGLQINHVGHLYKTYTFDDFLSPLAFANKIAVVAEQEAHHPDITISWGKCAVEIWTHKIDGLTESDFILAAKIQAI